MCASRAAIEVEFDRLAAFEDEVGFDHSVHCYRWLLGRLPSNPADVVEVGCGTGTFTTLLARRARHVLALDLSTRMLDRARQRCAGQPNITFRHLDVHDWEPAARSVDVVVSIGTAHHLDIDALLPRWTAALRPNGRLLILDALEHHGLGALPRNLVARVYVGWRRVRATGRWHPDPALVAAWAEHARFGGHAGWAEVQRRARAIPGARARRHLPWRYSLEWTAPAA